MRATPGIGRNKIKMMHSHCSVEQNNVHVWFAFVTPLKSRIVDYAATLNTDEIARGDRFKFQRDREQYVLGRGILRELLSRYSGAKAADLRFGYGLRGKPFLVEADENTDLRFNISHAPEAFLCALACGSEVGVDLESLQRLKDEEVLARQCFSLEEARAFAGLSTSERKIALTRCWTRKEAYAKARGEGLFLDLRSFSVFGREDAAPQLSIPSDPQEAARWTLIDLDVPEGYVAALAVEGHGQHVRCFRWPEDSASLPLQSPVVISPEDA